MFSTLKEGFSNIQHSFKDLNNSKYFAGVIMIMLNIGSKYITIKLSKSQEAYLKSSVARQLLIFSIIWMGTRDLLISFIMSAVFIVMTDHLFNEKSKYCVLPESLRAYEDLIDTNKDGKISQSELDKARKILERAHKEETQKFKLKNTEGFTSQLI